MSIPGPIQKRITSMPPLPVVCARILSKLQDQNLELSAIADLIQYDPGITANLLRIVNSAYFRVEKPITSLKEACLFAGTKKIMQLALAQGMSGVLNKPLAAYCLGPEELLQHSAWVAVASEEFCKALHLRVPDTIFTAGLLHDIGKLVLNDLVLAEKNAMERVVAEQNITHVQAERIVLGTDHAEVGAQLLAEWKLPRPLVETARRHHDPEQASQHGEIVNIVHLANVLSATLGIAAGNTEAACRTLCHTLQSMKLSSAIVESVASSALEKMQALKKLLARQNG